MPATKQKKTWMINRMTEQFSRNSFLPQNRRSQVGFPLRPAMPLLGASSASKTTMVRCLLPSVARRTLRNLACAAAGQRKKNKYGVLCLTLLETNVAPEKVPSQKETSLIFKPSMFKGYIKLWGSNAHVRKICRTVGMEIIEIMCFFLTLYFCILTVEKMLIGYVPCQAWELGPGYLMEVPKNVPKVG